MPITFNTNLAALGAQRNIGIASNAASSSLSKLSSGSRVPQAKDDAAALAVGSKLKGEVAGLTQAGNNAAQAISLLQIADGALSTVGDIVQRMKTLATQSSSGQLGNSERVLLNQEYTALSNEIARISATSNFNGTTLLAGATTVSSRFNSLAAFTGTGANQNDTSAANIMGPGFTSATFNSNFGNGVVRVRYEAASRNMTVTDLVSQRTQTVQLSAPAIAAGATETVNFGTVGVSFTLNTNFDKAANIATNAVNSARVSVGNGAVLTTPSASLGLTSVTANTITLENIALTGTGTNRFSTEELAGVTVALSGAHTAVQLASTIVVGGRTFNNTSAAQTFVSAGAFNYNYNDNAGNTFTIRITTTGNASGGTAAGNITIPTTMGGRIENTGLNRPEVTGITNSGTVANQFNWGNLTNARIAINAAAAATTGATVTIGGVAFSTANAGGATADTTTVGLKTLTLADANGNAFSVRFNVTQAFANGGSGQIVLGEFGAYVAANSATTNTTSFDFKVGTGTSVNDNITVGLSSSTLAALGLSGLDVLSVANSNTAIAAINSAIDSVSSRRADIGASQSRLEFATNNINVAIENATAATSALLDVDVSSEITEFTSKQVLLQAGVSLLAQANQQPALLLRLLQ